MNLICCFCFVLLPIVVSVIMVICCLCAFLSMCLFMLCVLSLTMLVNCLLNAFAISVDEGIVFSLKVIVL